MTAVCQGGSARQTQGWSHKPLGVLAPQVQSRQQSQGGLPGRGVNTQACLLSLTTVSDLSDHPSQDTRSKREKQHPPHKGIHRRELGPRLSAALPPRAVRSAGRVGCHSSCGQAPGVRRAETRGGAGCLPCPGRPPAQRALAPCQEGHGWASFL